MCLNDHVGSLEFPEDEVFRHIRDKYVETFTALQHENEFDARRRLLSEWHEYVSSARSSEL